MSKFECPKCNIVFGRNHILKKHLEKKNDCRIYKTLIFNTNENKYVCKYCDKLYCDKYILLNHYKICKIKKEQTIIEQYNVLNNKVIELENKFNNTIISNTVNNNINTINNTVNLTITPFKDSNNYFNPKQIKYLLDRGYKSVEECIKQKHFNADHPENHNVYISNNRDKYANIYDGKEWIIEDKNEIVDNLISDNTDYLIDNFNDMIDELDTKIINKFNKFKNDMEDGGESIADFSKRMKENVKILLYNNRNMIISTIKLKTSDKKNILVISHP